MLRPRKRFGFPTFWLFIAASRNVSAWVQYSGGGNSDQYLEGSPFDRAVLTVVLTLGVIVLLGRTGRVGAILKSNLPILFYFMYCFISVLWSDFPDVSSKRWFRALGDVVMVLIVLTDPHWTVAFRRLLSRIGFVVVPLSILFIRYFPSMGRAYSVGGAPSWTGVATDKNALGMICLVFGLAALFRFLQVRAGEESTRRKGPMIANGAVFVMALYLLWEANSATAFSCFFLAGIPMVLTYLFRFARKPAIVHPMVFAGSWDFLLGTLPQLWLGIGGGLGQKFHSNGPNYNLVERPWPGQEPIDWNWLREFLGRAKAYRDGVSDPPNRKPGTQWLYRNLFEPGMGRSRAAKPYSYNRVSSSHCRIALEGAGCQSFLGILHRSGDLQFHGGSIQDDEPLYG